MAKLSIGIGEDFPVEEKAGDEACARHHGHHRHRSRHAPREGWHKWLHERFSRSEKKDGE